MKNEVLNKGLDKILKRLGELDNYISMGYTSDKVILRQIINDAIIEIMKIKGDLRKEELK